MADTLNPAGSEELVYAQAIVILADDLYPRKLEIIREYIQNASDAIDMFQRVAAHLGNESALEISLSIQGKSLTIFDNGIGMDGEEMQKLKRIAYSEKPDDAYAGHKGIGRLAGIAVAKKLLISSTTFGDDQLHKFEFRAQEFKDELIAKRKHGITEPASAAILRHTTITSIPVDREHHYTMVELRDIDDDRYPELLNPAVLREYISDLGPVGFAPDFGYGALINKNLFRYVPDYSPKTIWITTGNGQKSQIYKPYNDQMEIAEPEFVEIENPADTSMLLAYCWYAVKGELMLGELRPAGTKFVVAGNSSEQKQRLAGLVYKLFGFSIGDRTLPLRSLWSKDYTRALWFTGEIHIVDKDIRPTTDRSQFGDNPTRALFYQEASKKIAKRLNARAQEISYVRTAFEVAEKWQRRFDEVKGSLNNGGFDRTQLKALKEELHSADTELRKVKKSTDDDINKFVGQITREVTKLSTRLDEAKAKKAASDEIRDVAKELSLTTQARRVYQITMQTVEHYFGKDKQGYHELSTEVQKALRKRL